MCTQQPCSLGSSLAMSRPMRVQLVPAIGGDHLMWSHKNMVVFASIRGGPVEAYLEREDGTKEMVAFDAPSIMNAEERWSQMSERPEQLARWLQQSPR